uniref:Uncharacterized protein n=1 Tax=Anguilla anguilla TaxID=7936 RepID=A0A0E9WSC6_ANGAN
MDCSKKSCSGFYSVQLSNSVVLSLGYSPEKNLYIASLHNARVNKSIYMHSGKKLIILPYMLFSIKYWANVHTGPTYFQNVFNKMVKKIFHFYPFVQYVICSLSY